MRDFTWGRQEIVEHCSRIHDHVHLVINSPTGRKIVPTCGKRALWLFFWDLEPDRIRRAYKSAENHVRAQELIDGCFTAAHAAEIAAFVTETQPADLVVNCEAGVSRSPAVVAALRRKYGGDVDQVFKKACPNIHVANVLAKALGIEPFERPKYSGIVVPGSDA